MIRVLRKNPCGGGRGELAWRAAELACVCGTHKGAAVARAAVPAACGHAHAAAVAMTVLREGQELGATKGVVEGPIVGGGGAIHGGGRR